MEDWLEDSNENSAAEWLGEMLVDAESIDHEMITTEQAISFPPPTRFNSGMSGSFSDPSDPDVTQAVSAIVNMIPAIVQAVVRESVLGEEENLGETTDRLVEMFWESKPAEQSDEFWGAIVTALASIIPTVIPAIRNLVQSKRRRRQVQRQPPSQRRTPISHRRRESMFESADGYDEDYFPAHEGLDDEGVGAAVAAIAPIALQALPAIMPLITQLLSTSIPMIAKAAQGAAAAQPAQTPPVPTPVAGLTPVAPPVSAPTATPPVRRARESVQEYNEEFEYADGNAEYEGDPIFL